MVDVVRAMAVAAALPLLAGTAPPPAAWAADGERPLVIAHRGA